MNAALLLQSIDILVVSSNNEDKCQLSVCLVLQEIVQTVSSLTLVPSTQAASSIKSLKGTARHQSIFRYVVSL